MSGISDDAQDIVQELLMQTAADTKLGKQPTCWAYIATCRPASVTTWVIPSRRCES